MYESSEERAKVESSNITLVILSIKASAFVPVKQVISQLLRGPHDAVPYIGTTIEDLEASQQNMFYEAVGHIVSAESEATRCSYRARSRLRSSSKSPAGGEGGEGGGDAHVRLGG